MQSPSTDNHSETEVPPVLTPPFFWYACFIILAIARIQLGGVPCLQLSIHQSIVDSILAGNDWGRQALIGNLDNPFLPTIALLTVNVICRVFGGDPAVLLCSISQAIIMAFFLRMTFVRRKWLLAFFMIVLVPIVPFLRNLLFTLDPNWFSAVPAVAAVYYLIRWQELKNLRDLIIVAIFIGLLAFAGPGAILIAFCFIAVMAEQYRLKNQGSWQDHRGIRTILWGPLLYCIAIWLLWNSLIFNDIFFGLRDAAHRMTVKILHPVMPFNCLLFLPMAVTLAILSINSSHKWTARCLLPACFIIPAVAFISARFGIGPAGLGPLTFGLFLSTVSIAFFAFNSAKHTRIATYVAAACTIVVACLFSDLKQTYEVSEDPEKQQEKASLPTEAADAPQAQELLDFIDRYWPDSRIILVGSRLPAIYPDPEAKRFVSKINFNEKDFLAQAKEEQLHILIPPPDGRFYPIQNSILADIHKNGRDWLFLEKVFPNNWQLWRSTVPPNGESKLMRDKTDN